MKKTWYIRYNRYERGFRAPHFIIVFMIVEMKDVICPQCGRVITRRQVEASSDIIRDEYIRSDMICRECRRKIEERLLKKED